MNKCQEIFSTFIERLPSTNLTADNLRTSGLAARVSYAEILRYINNQIAPHPHPELAARMAEMFFKICTLEKEIQASKDYSKRYIEISYSHESQEDFDMIELMTKVLNFAGYEAEAFYEGSFKYKLSINWVSAKDKRENLFLSPSQFKDAADSLIKELQALET